MSNLAKNTTSSARGDSRETLVKAAAQLFRTKGYERTTVRDLANAVGMQSGSLFYHFKNKEEILYEVMKDGISSVASQVTLAAEQSQKEQQGPQEQVIAMTVAHLTVLLGGDNASLAVMLYEWQSLPAELRERIIAKRNDYEEIWYDVLIKAREQGLWNGDERFTIRLYMGALNWATQWFKANGPMSLEELAASIANELLFRK